MQTDALVRLAQNYWTLRQRGDLSEARTIAHNALLDAMTAAGIEYEDREHAAAIARGWLTPEHDTRGETMTLTIDKEFQELIPALTPEEYAGLEQSLKEFGCQEIASKKNTS